MQTSRTEIAASLAVTQFHCEVARILDLITRTQAGAIERAAGFVADTVAGGGIVYAFGSGHSQSVAAEFYYRAGGLAPCDVIHDKTFGLVERLPGYAALLLRLYPVRKGDLMVVISNSGRNPLSVEMALEARRLGMAVVGITSLAHSRSVAPRAPLGKRLFEVCDVVIDTCGAPGDAIIPVAGEGSLLVGATSTIAGAFIAQCIVCAAAQELSGRGVPVPVLCSMNLDDGDARNRELLDALRERIRGL